MSDGKRRRGIKQEYWDEIDGREVDVSDVSQEEDRKAVEEKVTIIPEPFEGVFCAGDGTRIQWWLDDHGRGSGWYARWKAGDEEPQKPDDLRIPFGKWSKIRSSGLGGMVERRTLHGLSDLAANGCWATEVELYRAIPQARSGHVSMSGAWAINTSDLTDFLAFVEGVIGAEVGDGDAPGAGPDDDAARDLGYEDETHGLSITADGTELTWRRWAGGDTEWMARWTREALAPGAGWNSAEQWVGQVGPSSRGKRQRGELISDYGADFYDIEVTSYDIELYAARLASEAARPAEASQNEGKTHAERVPVVPSLEGLRALSRTPGAVIEVEVKKLRSGALQIRAQDGEWRYQPSECERLAAGIERQVLDELWERHWSGFVAATKRATHGLERPVREETEVSFLHYEEPFRGRIPEMLEASEQVKRCIGLMETSWDEIAGEMPWSGLTQGVDACVQVCTCTEAYELASIEREMALEPDIKHDAAIRVQLAVEAAQRALLQARGDAHQFTRDLRLRIEKGQGVERAMPRKRESARKSVNSLGQAESALDAAHAKMDEALVRAAKVATDLVTQAEEWHRLTVAIAALFEPAKDSSREQRDADSALEAARTKLELALVQARGLAGSLVDPSDESSLTSRSAPWLRAVGSHLSDLVRKGEDVIGDHATPLETLAVEEGPVATLAKEIEKKWEGDRVVGKYSRR